MHSSTYYLASSGLTFEIMCFGWNTCRIFNHHLPEAHSNPTQGPLEQMDNPWSRREPEPPSRATPEALYSGTASCCMFSPRIRTGITGGPNLQITGLAFTRNLFFKKGQPRTGARAGKYDAYSCASRMMCIAQPCGMHCPALTAVHCTDAGCTAVRVDPSGVYICTEGASHLYSCTD
jgi:hypothetical protein